MFGTGQHLEPLSPVHHAHVSLDILYYHVPEQIYRVPVVGTGCQTVISIVYYTSW